MLIVLADAGGYVDDAVDGLSSSSVYVSPEVHDAAALTQAIEAQIGDASVGVAVFSSNAALEASGPDIVVQLGQRTGYDTIVVAVGDDLSAGSHVLEQGEAMSIANQAESSAGSLEGALTETVQGVVAAADSPAPTSSGGADGLGIGLAIGAAVIVAAIVGVVAAIRIRRRRPATEQPLPASLGLQVQALHTLSVEYAAAGVAGHPIAGQTAQDIEAIADNVTQLFERLAGKAAEDQRRLAEIEYGDKLAKLTTALDRHYLLDILMHPNLWDDPDERVSEVRDAVVGVSEQLVENIKQVNAQRALQFQVSLDTLIGRRKELRDWDREFRRATDDGQAPSA
ncbi:hypothetical protein [Microbacterium deminutum]|uniref:TPM domain-containing protein n=1 Tax=Microbacterium deminutum TaxID=344164 RepID=A0ABN2QQD8_9MICO